MTALELIDIEKRERTGYLDLGNCGLTELPDLSELTWLTELDLSRNKISDYSSLEKLTGLTMLELSSNQIGTFRISDASFLEKLTGLTTLCLRSNQISSIQINDVSFLKRLATLTMLDLRYNQISDASFLENLTGLTMLDLRDNQISDISFLEKLTGLTMLYLSSNPINDYSFLKKLTGLTKVFLSSNQIIDISFLENLTGLTTLSLSSNRISDISFLENLTGLTALDLRYNQISDASFLKKLTSLVSLDLRYNQISDASFLKQLTRLTKLYLRSNQINDVSYIEGHTGLSRLDLSSNQINDLTPLLPFIKNGISVTSDFFGKGINVFQNPLTTPPVEIVQQGNQAILNYFQEKTQTGTEKSLEAKVLLVGEAQAGKTSLLTRLLHPGAPLPTAADRTKGLDIFIERYGYPLASQETMRLNLFDFGGQDHYKPLHQFFYSKNTLYVLVTKNGDAAVNDFDFWFDTAQVFGQGSPVLVVNNLFGEVRSLFDRSKFPRFASLIQCVKDVNLGDFADRRWLEVKAEIEHLASRLPHVHEEIPKSWANVRRALAERRSEQVLSLTEYLRICALPQNGGMDKRRALHCSEYLHDIGVILHYQDLDDLRPWVIVRNEWATEAAYRVIDDPGIERRNGLFNHEDLRRIWQGADYEDFRPQLRELMRKFRLCYPLKGGEEFIAPQLLPARPPEGYAWHPESSGDLELFVEYDFMPPGLFSQLIVECHLLIAGERRLAWRDGAVLEIGNLEIGKLEMEGASHQFPISQFPISSTRAELRLQKRGGKQTIGIRAQGGKRRDLLTIADGKIEELHRLFGKGLRVERKIPCVCDRCASSEEKWFFNLSELEELRDGGLESHICIKGKKPVSIEKLLGNVFSKNVQVKAYEAQAAAEAGERLDAGHVQTLLKNGELQAALEILLPSHPEAATLLGEWNRTHRAYLTNKIGFEEWSRIETRLTAAATEMMG